MKYKFNLFELLKIVYFKRGTIPDNIDTNTNILLSKWLCYDRFSCKHVGSVIKDMWYLSPISYFYSLYFKIPKRNRSPFLKKVNKNSLKSDILKDKIKKAFGWSEKEYDYNKYILDKVVYTDKKYWKKEFGLIK